MGQKMTVVAWRTELWKVFSDDEIDIIQDRMDDVENEAAYIISCMEGWSAVGGIEAEQVEKTLEIVADLKKRLQHCMVEYMDMVHISERCR